MRANYFNRGKFYRRLILWSFILCLCQIFLTGCGSGKDRAGVSRTYGIDGYAYVPEVLSGKDLTSVSGLFTMEVPEVSFSPSNVYARDEEGNYYFLSRNYSLTGDGGIYLFAGTTSYTLYEDGRLISTVFGQDEDTVTTDRQEWEKVRARVHTFLYKTSSDGKVLYKLDLTDRTWGTTGFGRELAVLENGTVLVLAKEGILLADREGNFTGLLDTNMDGINDEEERDGNRYLMEGMDGSIFYVASDSPDMMVYKVVENGNLSLEKAEAFTGQYYGKMYPGLEGVLFSRGGVLYGYTGKEDRLAPLLKWQDSNLYENWVNNVVQVSEEEFLVEVITDDNVHTYYRLKRTPVEELPEKEVLVVATVLPTLSLERAIAEFNLLNPSYHVVLEEYEEKDRLDAALVSREPPDLLDMTNLNLYKYAGRDALEDLTGYFAQSSVIHQEDFLDQVIQGYTVDGRLYCVPLNFCLRTYMGRASQVGNSQGWTMEECMELTERFPDLCLASGFDRNADWLLTFLCGEYCLERFVDWEKMSCSFDSQDFQQFLTWLLECGKRTEKSGEEVTDWEDSLVSLETMHRFFDLMTSEEEQGQDLTLIGFPTVDGRPRQLADVYGALAMVSKSAHKDGAWRFLEYYLGEYHYEFTDLFPTKKEDFWGLVDFYSTPEYELDENGEKIQDVNGDYLLKSKNLIINGKLLYYMEREKFDEILEVLENVDFRPSSAQEDGVMGIVTEEAADYFNGVKKAEEVADIIQNRVTVLLGE